MPLYEYHCQSCGEREEKLEPVSAPTEHDCPKCGQSKAMSRQVSRTSFTLAGGGWHAQGYSAGAKAGTGPSPSPSPSPAKSEPAGGGGCAGGCSCH